MEIRALGEADVAIYWPLRLEALRTDPEAFGSDYEESRQRPLTAVAERLRDDGASQFTLGAFDGDRLIGTVTFQRESRRKTQHKGWIQGMYVTPSARGRGVGRALMEAAIARARTGPGLEQIQLGVVATNVAAHRLYLSLGFQVYGTEPHALKIAAQRFDEDLMVLFADPMC